MKFFFACFKRHQHQTQSNFNSTNHSYTLINLSNIQKKKLILLIDASILWFHRRISSFLSLLKQLEKYSNYYLIISLIKNQQKGKLDIYPDIKHCQIKEYKMVKKKKKKNWMLCSILYVFLASKKKRKRTCD